MDLPDKTFIDVLMYLLPGFVAAAIVYNLTPAPRPSPFERIVQALIFTILIQVGVAGIKHALFLVGTFREPIGPWNSDIALAWSIVVAIVLGLFFTWAENTDKVHQFLRKCGITHQTSYSSEWYGAFCQNKGFVMLHLKGERRLYGWPQEWPSTPNKGHFIIAQAEWLDGDKRIDLIGVEEILISAEDVEMVELMKPITQEKLDGRT